MVKKIDRNILNYRVIIEKERYENGKIVYSASCPTLGVFDYGDSIEKALKGIKQGIEGVIEFLTEQGKEIPVDYPEESIVTFTQIRVPEKTARLAVA
ncbi:hypothetical protein A3D84_03840 [Candidatus Woesebacteria bacterium RIFCSPHIGHO2_02_FULL_42_20]|uniref:HicB-like antitoxin of toxin-antitoxin system domain-containing protein n=1 Tax=Candidatus Woesebacteria bacterium RIFCSPHIGHO2_12_FULL_41_24 TaxID=1802510 RepID=A0A1F8AVL4_9BACT|nr:MAG: hypothetical protein A2W15_03995 [Candidatus Woesebacteria bacterium RBG_16_41_13]OGM29133.1 MAG: hypothetical protein A2873_00170 [Candidatus Woesebacteria bacterium RIFCSPHIGHO2_01_FULL_42_80]OGM35664.1 MAG: hypothetical protein A3D84_03840 [Candidatus Woesebacteria bacterium RIFCSPHIGHO2_02_FULL_42_20]OGM55275.1 MAG: hypothetical protein A3E44_03250 [Candidatus Woesebacteria bacterium RIFCSPHIGHO2_12_FULL_41_24]OGM66811.1 MAG: hypothetical protein A2969_00170 [Candidatus Woesebacteri